MVPTPVLDILFDPEEEPEEPILAASLGAFGGGPGWLLESGSESSHQFELEWMANSHRQWRADRTNRPPPIDVHYSASATTSFVRSVAPESDEAGPSGTAVVVISSDLSSKEDFDNFDWDTSSSEED